MLSTFLVPIHKEGWIFIGLFAFISLFLSFIWLPLSLISWLLTAWCIYFFRNPDRITPVRQGVVVSPADGKVQMITEVVPPVELEIGTEPLTRISIFMNVFNVHVNRIPCEGIVTAMKYYPGQFINATLDKASELNERFGFAVKSQEGYAVGCVQIAGLIARRICYDLTTDQAVLAGQRFGIIRFGSRCDVYLPKECVPLVGIGQTMIAGETVIADLARDKIESLTFEIRP